jgi:PmbA protein
LPELIDLAEAAVEGARRAGAEWADAVCANYRDTAVGVEKSSLRECETAREMGLGVRAYFRGGRGISTCLHPTLAASRRCGQEAAAMARAAHGDPDFVALPDPQPIATVEGLFDHRVAGLSAAQAVEWCRLAIEEAQAVAADAVLSGGVNMTWGRRALASSTGMRVLAEWSRLSLGWFATVRRGDDVGSFYDYDVARRLADFVPAGVAEKATRHALGFLGGKPLPTGKMPVVFAPLAADSLVMTLVSAASAEGIQRNRSFLVGKEGQPIASEHLTVREDPFIPAGVSSMPADGEGVPKERRVLIDRGVLTTYLHNSYTAHKAGVANTAHALRGGYDAAVGIGPSNLLAQPGDRTEAEIIAEIDEGLYINDASLSADPISGDLSATVDFGCKIKKGRLTTPVESTMIGGNVLDLAGRLDAVSSDYREEPGRIMPSIRLSMVQVSSGG